MNSIKNNWHILILILISLTPLIWFFGKGDVIINGLDTNFPLDPIVWINRRNYVWNDTINAGIDSSSSVSGAFFHLIQVLPYIFGFGLRNTQIISLIFWFSAIVMSGYFFVGSFIKNNKVSKCLFVLVYAYNIYLFNTWENIKVSNLALVVGLPLFLGLIIRKNNNNIGSYKFLLLSAVFAIVSSGSGINPAYLFTIFGGIVIYTLFAIFVDSRRWVGVCKNTAVVFAVVLLVNAYWILPLFRFLFISKSISAPEDIGFTNWLSSLSKDTSLLNVLRLQGAWDWYADDGYGLPTYIPYALNYFKNPYFIIFSFALPFLSTISLIFKNRKQSVHYYLFFVATIVIGVFFGAGLHPPTGTFYGFLVDKIPYLNFFRSPWYIFTPYVILGYCGLLALIFENMSSIKLFKTGVHKFLLYSSVLIFVVGHLLYSYPIISGKIFRPGRPDSFYVSFPDYILDSKKLLEADNDDGRVFMYPDDQLENFDWGYRGTESIISLFSIREAVAPSFAFGGNIFGNLMDQFYYLIKIGDINLAMKLLDYFNADSLLVKNDAVTQLPKLDIDIDNFDKSIIGKWILYRSETKDKKKIYTSNEFYIEGMSDSDLAQVIPHLNRQVVIVSSEDSEVKKIDRIDFNVNELLKSENILFESNQTNSNQSYLFEVIGGKYTIVLERKNLSLDEIKVNSQTISFAESTIDSVGSYIILSNLNIPKGKHVIDVSYPISENILDFNNKTNPSSLSSLRKSELPESTEAIVAYNSNDDNEEWLVIPTFSYKYSPYVDYKLSFDYKYFYGIPPIIHLIQEKDKLIFKATSTKTGLDTDWTYISELIEPIRSDSKLSMVIKMPKVESGQRSKMFFENISLQRVFDNQMFVIQDTAPNNISPKVEYEKISPVEYRVRLDKSEMGTALVFMENYSPDWIVKSEQRIDNIHFSAFGYANAWYIPPDENTREITIYYKGQDYFNIGVVISMISLMGILIFPLINKIYESFDK